jgi:hypothetical protein
MSAFGFQTEFSTPRRSYSTDVPHHNYLEWDGLIHSQSRVCITIVSHDLDFAL